MFDDITDCSGFWTLVLSFAIHWFNRKVKNNQLCSWKNTSIFFFDLLCLGLFCFVLFCLHYILLEFISSWHVSEFWSYRSHWMEFWNISGRIAIFNYKDVDVTIIFSLLPPLWIHIHICMYIDVCTHTYLCIIYVYTHVITYVYK